MTQNPHTPSCSPEPLSFTVTGTDTCCCARAGVLTTPHATVFTPVFMPVGTQATVKSLSPRELDECGCPIILANTYHLRLRPGDELIRQAGGLHRFEGWDRALLTDSGGFQVFSLRDISRISDEGVWFRSHIDGALQFFSPEAVMAMEHNLGADIIMMFDECPPASSDPAVVGRAVERTIQWAARCVEAHTALPFHFGYPQALFGIIQGSTIEALRERCCRELTAMDLPGYAVGGLAVGEEREAMYATAAYTAARLPADKPRYLMGVGKPQDILTCISHGIDMFDCVIPTRNARNGSVYTWQGKVNIRNARYTYDFDHTLDDRCQCYTCSHFSNAYLRHLYMAGEILAIRLLTLHNVYFFVDMVRQARQRILEKTFTQWKDEMCPVLHTMKNGDTGAENHG